MLKYRKLIFIPLFVIVAAFCADLFVTTQHPFAILMYHSVSGRTNPKDKLIVSSGSFERQMRFLKFWRYNVIRLEELGQLLRQNKRIPARTVAITFDDGYKNNYEFAYPVLKKYALPATIFIIVEEVSRSQGDRISWEEIALMRDSGLVSFGSHCLGPEPLVNLGSEAEIKRQIFDSKKIIEERIGKKVSAFSYPEGRFSSSIRQLVVDASYDLAVSTNPGKKFSDTDIFALKRIKIAPSSDNLFIFWLHASGYYALTRRGRHK